MPHIYEAHSKIVSRQRILRAATVASRTTIANNTAYRDDNEGLVAAITRLEKKLAPPQHDPMSVGTTRGHRRHCAVHRDSDSGA